MNKQMILQFENDLEYQNEAISSICDIFEGEETFQSIFSLTDNRGRWDNLGYGNTLLLSQDEILANMRAIQLKSGLPQSTEKSFAENGMNFSVEMETGTGKTYVYLKSIFELNKRYGFTKFIIVVPSIAIKEGTKKTLTITRDHFRGDYENVVYDYFVYDSSNLEQVRSFVTADTIQIMVINIDAFRKSFENDDENNKSNIIHRYDDKLGYKPIDLIKETNPIVIIDEPQSVDNTPKSKEAIASLNPLCCLRYSATHRNPYNMMYRLDSVDAYEKKLVKQIEVATVAVEDFQNEAYAKLIKVDNTNGIKAQIEVDCQSKGIVNRKKIWVKQYDDLFDKTKREQYEGFIVEDIWFDGDLWNLSFTSNDKVLKQGFPIGSVGDDMIKREQIRMTIESHLDKELVLNPQGIKVLSLLFIDKVSNYRVYDEEGNRSLGKYGVMFEEEYKKLISRPKYQSLMARETDVAQVHNGYFSIDKKSKASNKKDKFEIEVDTTGKTAKDDDTFNLIMRDKEQLLSFDSDLRFIFSHSALCEGWDNPNVFQICTLIESSSDLDKRQKIGRGLRLCVNQDGQRIRGFEVNTLTVMANESFEDFTKSLQNEIEKEMGIVFGVIRKHAFARIVTKVADGNTEYLGEEKSLQLFNSLIEKGYAEESVINNKTQEVGGKIQDKLKIDLKANSVEIPTEFLPVKDEIIKVLKRVAGNYLNIKNVNDRKILKPNKEVLLDSNFKELWDKIKYKTKYSVEVNTEALIEKCVEDIQENLLISKGKFVRKKVKLVIDDSGVSQNEDTISRNDRLIEEKVTSLPDIVSFLQNETGLTRSTIVSILLKSKKLDAFKKNPQAYIEFVLDVIRRKKVAMLVDGIKYQRLNDDVWCQELFESQELKGYLNNNLMASTRSPYDYVIYDSDIEKEMAKKLEESNNVKVYAKLPSWFVIDTPLGTYNPDWVLLWEKDDEQKLYFVVETKGKNVLEELALAEQQKIRCGKKHFKAIGTGVEMLAPIKDFETLSSRISAK